MTEVAETLSERICTVECMNQNSSNGYDRLTARMSLQEDNMYAIKITSKDETLSLLDRLGILNEGIRTEHWTGDSYFTKDSGKKI